MSEKNAHILIIDDEKNYLLVLQTLLEDEGYTVTALSDPETALAFLQESEVDVVVTDMKMPRITGLDVLERVKKQWPYIPVLIMTAFGTIESAVETMKYGAFDYITKPFSNDELLLSIHNAVELAQAHREYKLLQEAMQERFGLHTIIGRSAGISQVKLMVERAAPGRTTVLITGESGTGKELVARAVHLGSPRKDKPFVVVECAALTGDALEKELFGQETASSAGTPAIRRGRVEQADGGTLFLDDMAALTPDLQVKLLRLLQDRRFERVGGSTPIEVDVRFVMATNTDLAKKVEEGTFREDLYYRVNVVQIHLPPLRERREDIPLLVAHFVAKFTADNNMKQQKSFSTQALNYLTGYDWPGNIRQLENVVESCMVLVPGNVIEEENLPAEIRDEESQFKSAVDLLPVQLDLADTLQKIEAALIRRALVRADLVQVKAAELLNISKSLLQYKLKKYGITGH
ncbi:MAG: sigma-54-dependent transcriptional regulator [Desulfovibrio sp.]|jgi:two-component system NtrC family response regulator